MTFEASRPSSRRAVLGGAIGAAVASIAAAFGRPTESRGANGGAILLGVEPVGPFNGVGTNQASATTTTFTTAGIGLKVQSNAAADGHGVVAFSTAATGFMMGVYGDAASTSGYGVYGYASADSGSTTGVYGRVASAGGTGVRGEASGGTGFSTGVYGLTTSPNGSSIWGVANGWAVWGESTSTDKPATTGWSLGNQTGVLGWSGPAIDYPTGTPAKTGVYGYAVQDANARGVHGRSASGRGVYGQATSGQGVRGFASTGTGVYASTSTGVALRAVGRVQLDSCAGVATILAGSNAVTVTPGIDIVPTSAVVATLQGNPAGTTTVKSVAINATANTFRIYLTSNAAANVKVAWHVFG